MPAVVESDDQALLLGALIKRMRDVDARIESIRTLEGEPYLRGKNAVDQWFFALRDKLGRRNKNDRSAKPGAIWRHATGHTDAGMLSATASPAICVPCRGEPIVTTRRTYCGCPATTSPITS